MNAHNFTQSNMDSMGRNGAGAKMEAWRVKLSDDGESAAGELPDTSSSSSSSQPPAMPTAAVDKSVSVEARCSCLAVMLRNSLRVPIVELGAEELRLGLGSQVGSVKGGANTGKAPWRCGAEESCAWHYIGEV